MKIKAFNIPSLLLIVAALVILRYGFFERIPGVVLALSGLHYALLVVSAVCIAACGFLIDNISGSKKDTFGITEEKGVYIYTALTVVGVGTGFYLANVISRPWFAALFVAIAGGQYLYGTTLRHSLAIGNVVTAAIITLAFMLPIVFNLYPANPFGNASVLPILFKQALYFAAPVFLAGLLHSIIKDLRDTDADYNTGYSTLPISLGKARAAKIAFFTGIALAAATLFILNKYFIDNYTALGICIALVLGPQVFFLIKIWEAATQKDFVSLEKVTRAIVFFTIIAIAATTI